MDEIRVEAQERFDLVDMNRLKSYVHEAFTDILGKLFGNYMHFKGLAALGSTARPLIARNFQLTSTLTDLDVTVERVWTSGIGYNALIYDKDGKRITGANSATSKVITVNATPGATTRYLRVRRAATDDTPETRRFYSETAGKYTSTIDTRTIDDWELGESATDPDEDSTQRDAGWLKIGTFRTDGTKLTQVTASNPDWLDDALLDWPVGSPGDPPYVAPQNLFGVLAGLRQIIKYMRNQRGSFDDPQHDACFDVEGGVRFAKGKTTHGGPDNVYERLTPKTTPDTLKLQKNAPASANDLHFYRAQGFIGGGDTGGGAPDPANRRGFCYATDLDVVDDGDLVAVAKPWGVPAAGYFPGRLLADSAYTPWADSSNKNRWLMDSTDTSPVKCGLWFVPMQTSDATPVETNWLYIPIQIPHKCQFSAVHVTFQMKDTIPTDVGIRFQVLKRTEGTETTLYEKLFNAANGPLYDDSWPADEAWSYFSLSPFSGGAQIIDNSAYGYVVRVRQEIAVSLGGATKIYLYLTDTEVVTSIREASHVY